MRRKLVAIAALIVAVVLAAAIFSRPRAPQGFAMCIARGAPKGPSALREPVLTALARQLSNEERTALEEALALSASRWEARANPLLEDLEDSSPDAPLEAWSKTAPSFVRIAQLAAKTQLCAPDGFCVRPRTRNACPAGWTPTRGEEEARARFVLWPWGHAIRLRARTEADARTAAEQLRHHARTSERIALVLASDDDAVTHTAPFLVLRDRWKRHAIAGKIARAEKIDPPTEPGLVLDPRELVVIPRLGTIQDDRALAAEVHGVAPMLE